MSDRMGERLSDVIDEEVGRALEEEVREREHLGLREVVLEGIRSDFPGDPWAAWGAKASRPLTREDLERALGLVEETGEVVPPPLNGLMEAVMDARRKVEDAQFVPPAVFWLDDEGRPWRLG